MTVFWTKREKTCAAFEVARVLGSRFQRSREGDARRECSREGDARRPTRPQASARTGVRSRRDTRFSDADRDAAPRLLDHHRGEPQRVEAAPARCARASRGDEGGPSARAADESRPRGTRPRPIEPPSLAGAPPERARAGAGAARRGRGRGRGRADEEKEDAGRRHLGRFVLRTRVEELRAFGAVPLRGVDGRVRGDLAPPLGREACRRDRDSNRNVDATFPGTRAPPKENARRPSKEEGCPRGRAGARGRAAPPPAARVPRPSGARGSARACAGSRARSADRARVASQATRGGTYTNRSRDRARSCSLLRRRNDVGDSRSAVGPREGPSRDRRDAPRAPLVRVRVRRRRRRDPPELPPGSWDSKPAASSTTLRAPPSAGGGSSTTQGIVSLRLPPFQPCSHYTSVGIPSSDTGDVLIACCTDVAGRSTRRRRERGRDVCCREATSDSTYIILAFKADPRRDCDLDSPGKKHADDPRPASPRRRRYRRAK